ncbi:unnamed protein product [Peronospora farinosa]|uniref:Uncharacterized protein n=1 Tax=Peronospora farinosa TaxID=134698 RepID=A0AAV0T1H1_9STRA|nr:unnamed protein product [Peronospora farinosa]CAI5710636.1 unnamed protein product [Peronospora farinosa]
MKTLCSQAFGAKDYNLLGKYVLGTIVTAGVTDRLRDLMPLIIAVALPRSKMCSQRVMVVLNSFLVVGLTQGQFRLPELRFVRCPKGTAMALFLRLVGYVVYMDLYRKFHHRCA